MPALLLSPIARWLALGALLLAIAGGLYACGRDDGREAARTESLDRTIKAVETRRDAEDDAARQPDPAGRLLDRWGRD